MTTRRQSTKLHVHETLIAVARAIGVTPEELHSMDAVEFKRRRDMHRLATAIVEST